MANAEDFAADNNNFNYAFADMFLENPVNLQEINVQDIQDADNQFEEQYIASNEKTYAELNPVPQQQTANSGNVPDAEELNQDQIDEIEELQFAPKTKKQTLWGVKIFRGVYIFVHN